MMRNKDYPLYELKEYESLSQMVCEKARTCADKIAFQYMRGKNIQSITYRKYLEDILATGKYLSEHYGRRSHVAILGENSYQWLVVFMAAVMSGNVAVPLDKELDTAGIQDLLTRSNSQICVYSDTYSDVAKELDGNRSVEFLSMKVLSQAQGVENVDCKILDEWRSVSKKGMAALFYTSGTSGKSKGVMLSQENIMEDINSGCKNICLDGDTLVVLPFHHAFGLSTAVFAAFNYEHTIFINSSLKSMKRDMLAGKPRLIMMVPLFVETFHKTIWNTAKNQGKEKDLRLGMILSSGLLRLGIDIRRYLFRSVLDGFGGKLKYIVCGGAALKEKYIQEFRTWGIEILNAYGITECSPGVAISRNYFHKDASVGPVIKGCEVRIKTDTANSRHGELLVQGKNVMLGYYQDEQATKDAFENGWFKTGDLGYIDEDGFLYITGRTKNLIILSNGENVSPEELESLLLDDELVKEVLVYAENESITAEVYPDPENSLDDVQKQLQDILDACNRKLPAYKRIQRLKIRQEEFPKTTTRKIKR